MSSSNYSLSTALWLSLFFGGFGADRFYLGHVFTGFLKLFSLGGLGVWSFIDVIFIACGVLTPADGTLFKGQEAGYGG
jgi:TM2 domain-containing membrane protein YozV